MAEKIFTRNFHLADSHTLARYRETGGYTALPKALGDGAGGHHRGGQEGQPAGTRRRGLSDRRQVGLHPEGLDGAQVPRDQRRRGRAGHVQGPLPDGARPPRPDRGHGHRGARHRLAPGLRLHPRRVREAVAGPGRRGQGGLRGGAPRQEHPGLGLRLRHRAPPRRRRLHLRRGDGAPVLPRGEEGVAQDQAALPRGQGSVRPPHHRQQRRDHHGGAAHHQPRGGVVRRARHQEPGRHAALLRLRSRREARASSRRRYRSRCGS